MVMVIFLRIAAVVFVGCAGYDTKFCGGLDMELLWNAFFILVPFWVFVLIPFMTFFYEADDGMLMAGTSYSPNPTKRSKLVEALCYEMGVLIVVVIFFATMYLLFSTSSIPVQDYLSAGETGFGLGTIDSSAAFTIKAFTNNSGFNPAYFLKMDNFDEISLDKTQNKGSVKLDLQVSMLVFFGNLMAWVGWFLFALFGGIGLTALPLDLILAFVNRPKHMDAVELGEVRSSLQERVNELVDIGELIKIEREEKAQAGMAGAFASFSMDSDKRKAARDERQAILGFKQAVFLLEKDVEDFQAVSVNSASYNPLIPFVKLILGVASVIISLFWFIHILVYVYFDPPLAPFLNAYFLFLDGFFPLFGVLSVALFTVYLLACAVKGCFKFGIRFFFFHIHPMRPGKTYMSSFMFNTALVLMCSMPVVQLCQLAFADYAAYSNIRQLFGVQVAYLEFFRYFWVNHIFIYCFMIISVLTSIYLALQPTDTSANSQALRDRLRARTS